MKRRKQCPKCDSLRVGCLPAQFDNTGHAQTVGTTVSRISRHKAGTIEAYICTDCGYYETYVTDPGDVPWEDLERFFWLNPKTDGGGPFR